MSIPQAAVVVYKSVSSTIFINNEKDYVQREINRGAFYEQIQLERHKTMIPYAAGAVVVDVGANIGNHSIFYAKHTKAERIIPLEANPVAAQLLKASVAANKLEHRIDLSQLEIAVSNRVGQVRICKAPENNLGATRIESLSNDQENGSTVDVLVHSKTIDTLLNGRRPSFIKIDVEGHEMLVLEGASNTIDEFRPSLAIEVNQANEKLFWQWVDKYSYTCIDFFHDYEGVRNYCLVPRS